MTTELLGMSKDELIQWACRYGCIGERQLRKQWDGLELFCAQHPVGMGTLLERIVKYSNVGYDLKHSIMFAKKEWE